MSCRAPRSLGQRLVGYRGQSGRLAFSRSAATTRRTSGGRRLLRRRLRGRHLFRWWGCHGRACSLQLVHQLVGKRSQRGHFGLDHGAFRSYTSIQIFIQRISKVPQRLFFRHGPLRHTCAETHGQSGLSRTKLVGYFAVHIARMFTHGHEHLCHDIIGSRASYMQIRQGFVRWSRRAWAIRLVFRLFVLVVFGTSKWVQTRAPCAKAAFAGFMVPVRF